MLRPARWRLAVPVISRTDGAVERWVLTHLLTLGVITLAIRSALGTAVTRWLAS